MTTHKNGITPYTLRTKESALLPESDVLVLNIEEGILTLLSHGEIIKQVPLSPTETYVIEVLLNDYPNYCPYEVVLSAITGKNIDICRERVLWGLEEGTIDVVMKPVRNLMGRCREKLNRVGIEVKSLIHMGYLLTPLPLKKHKKQRI